MLVGWHVFSFRCLIGFWFLVCYADTQLATQLQQRCIQVVCSNKEARKRLTESNGTPAKDLGPVNIDRRIHSHIVFEVDICIRRHWNKRGNSILSVAGSNSSVLFKVAQTWIYASMLLRNQLFRSIWFAETLLRFFLYFYTFCVASSSWLQRNILKGEKITQKIRFSIFLNRLLHRPGLDVPINRILSHHYLV